MKLFYLFLLLILTGSVYGQVPNNSTSAFLKDTAVVNGYLNDYVSKRVKWTPAEKSIPNLGEVYFSISTDPTGKIIQVYKKGENLNHVSSSKDLTPQDAVISNKFIIEQVSAVLESMAILNAENFNFDKTKISTKTYKVTLTTN